MKAFCIVLFCILCLTVDAWVGLIQSEPSPNNLGHCYAKTIGSMERGETRRMKGQCAEATCASNRDIRLTGCGSVAIEPPCRMVAGNLSKPFPDCCFEIECPELFEV